MDRITLTSKPKSQTKGVNLTTKVAAIRELLTLPNLKNPVYQRPYKWHQSRMRQLIDDINIFSNRSFTYDSLKQRIMMIKYDADSWNEDDIFVYNDEMVELFNNFIQNIEA